MKSTFSFPPLFAMSDIELMQAQVEGTDNKASAAGAVPRFPRCIDEHRFNDIGINWNWGLLHTNVEDL
jgi:hypothetical protein